VNADLTASVATAVSESASVTPAANVAQMCRPQTAACADQTASVDPAAQERSNVTSQRIESFKLMTGTDLAYSIIDYTYITDNLHLSSIIPGITRATYII